MLGKNYRVPREIDKRDLIFDARPKSAQDAVEDLIRDIKEAPEAMVPYQYDRSHQNVPESERYPKARPFDRIAEMVRELTYGEMVELATELWAIGPGEITAENLPQILWDWAISP